MRKKVATAGHRRSARISELEEKARTLAFQKRTQSIASSSSPPPSATKRRGRKRKSLQAVAVNSVTDSPHQEGEDQKHEDTAIKSEQTENLRMPKKQTLEFVLDILQRRDTQEIFAQPVDPQDVADYYNIIKEPMDFGTMRAKLQEGMYTSFEQFERDVFLISSNAMKFNSSTTVYYTEARAISELAQRLFRALKTEPENFQLEYSRTRRRPGRKPQSEASKPAKTGSSKDGVSLNDQSLKRTTQQSRASTYLKPYVSQMNNEFLPVSRDGRFLNSSGTERRMTYMSKNSLCSENEKILSTVYNTSKSLIPVTSSAARYGDSLMQFAKDLGPVAQITANKKLGKSPIGAANYLSWTPTPHFSKTADHRLVPTPSALQSPYNSNFISNPPAGSYKGKMVCNYGGPTILRGEPIPTYTANGGSINFNLLGEESTYRSRSLDGCDSSKTCENMDLLISTLDQISSIQSRNNYTPSGSYYPLTGYEDLPSAPPYSHINNESQSWLLNNQSKPYQTSKLSSTSKAAPAFASAAPAYASAAPAFASAAPSFASAAPAFASAALSFASAASSPASASASALQASWGLPAICDLPVLQPQDNEKIPLSQKAFFPEKQSQVASTQEIPLFNTKNFLGGAIGNRQGYHHQVASNAQFFWNTRRSNLLIDNKQPDLDLQL